MNNPIKPLIIFLIVLAGLLFIYTIFLAGFNTLNGKETIHNFFANSVIIIAGILSTNLGAVLGVTLVPPKSNSSPQPTFLGLRPTIHPDSELESSGTNTTQKLQIIACWVYIAGLLLATAFYLIAIGKNIPDGKVVSLIAEFSKTLVGVIFGALTVALGRN